MTTVGSYIMSIAMTQKLYPKRLHTIQNARLQV